MRVFAFPLLLLCAACADEPETPDEPTDFAAINEAAEGPGSLIKPEPIPRTLIESNNLSDAGCSIKDSQSDELIFIARDSDAHFFLDGELRTLAPHPVTQELPYGVSDHYDGLAYSVELKIEGDSERSVGSETAEYEGGLTIRDAKERIVFEYYDTVSCGA